MHVPPQTFYVKQNGVSIAYQVFGEGPPVVMAPSAPSHLDLMWIDPGYAQVLRRLGGFARAVVFDQRGVGLSDPVDHVPTVEEGADDLEAVMDAAGIERAVVFAMGMSYPAAAMFAARAPERVIGLVLGTPWEVGVGAVRDPSTAIAGFNERMQQALDAWKDATEHHWGQGRTLEIVAPSIVTERGTRNWGMLERASAAPAMIRAVTQAALEIDLREVLPIIRVPAIIVAREGSFQPRAIPERVAALIPGAEFDWQPEAKAGDGFEGFMEPFVDAIERLVTGRRRTRWTQRILATVLFTDIVDSTRTAVATGDEGWRDLLTRHESILREHVADAGGRVVKMMGDGSLSVFDGPARAITCAQMFVESVRTLGVEVRSGLHTGECEILDEDLAGLSVHIGARVGALAAAGEVLVSRTVKDLVVGSGLGFVSRGEFELKGIPGNWELFSLVDARAPAVPVAPEHPTVRASDRIVLTAAKRAPGLLRMAGRFTRS